MSTEPTDAEKRATPRPEEREAPVIEEGQTAEGVASAESPVGFAGSSAPYLPPHLTTEPRHTPIEAEREIRPLLSRANLMRLRGQWDEAIALCTEAIRIAPESAVAHSLLGDVYEAQGRLDEALQWFGMAVDLAPDSRSDREKLERVLQAKQAALRATDKQAGKENATPAPARNRTLEWLDKRFPPDSSDSVARLIFIACSILAVFLGIAAGFFFFRPREDRPRIIHLASPPPAPIQVAATPAPKEVPSAPSATPATVRLEVPGASATYDGQAQRVDLEMSWPAPGEGDSIATIREQILRSVVGVAQAAARVEPRAQRFSVQVRSFSGGQGSSEPLFSGELTPASFQGMDPDNAEHATLISAFTSLRWSSALTEVPPPEATPAPGEGQPENP